MQARNNDWQSSGDTALLPTLMVNRREILQIGMAAAAMPLDVAKAWATPLFNSNRDKLGPVPFYRAIYDSRFLASRYFGERMATYGIVTTVMSGDITPFWYNNLHLRWAEGPISITGLTTHGALFCLERLAWDHGMRVVFLAKHSCSIDGSVRHELEGAKVLIDAVSRMAIESDWVGVMSSVVSQYPHTFTSHDHRTKALLSSVEAITEKPSIQVPKNEALFSWVISPVTRN